jgi:sugar lactone lactonase YvrE
MLIFSANIPLMGAPSMQGEVLVKGAPIHAANGLMCDKDDRLFVASTFGQEILIMDPHDGKIIQRIGPEVGVGVPDDLAFGPDGSLYWTSIASGWVYRLSRRQRPDSSSRSALTRAFSVPASIIRRACLFRRRAIRTRSQPCESRARSRNAAGNGPVERI